MADSQLDNEAPSRTLAPSPRLLPRTNGYYSDDDARVREGREMDTKGKPTTLFSIPSNPLVPLRMRFSKNIESPPAGPDAARPDNRDRREFYYTTPSKPRRRRRHREHPSYSGVPSPPSPPPLEGRRMFSNPVKLPQPRTPQSSISKIDPGLLASLRNSPPAGDPTPGLKRSKSERTLSPRNATLTSAHTDVASQAWSRVTTSSAPGDLKYQYRPLEDLSIRLIRILPEKKTMIKCEIIHVSLEIPPRYVGVSYAWGDPGDTRKIELEGRLTPISVSLHGALQALRQKSEATLVWVDALCIDQQNRDERTQQVQLMTSIYSSAESVAIWLGPEEDDSSRAVDLLREVADEAKYPDRVSHILSTRAGSGDLAAVVSLFERDYWRRVWVVQEVFNAREITVYCGATKVPWDSYQLASAAFSRDRGNMDQYFPREQADKTRSIISSDQFSYSQVLIYKGPASLPDLRSYLGDGEGALLEILRACRRKLASDPRDKLFGILGVLPENIRDDFRADYNLSVKEVYTEVVDYLLKTTESLDVICEAIHFPAHAGSTKLPSFVPDWSHIPQTTSLGHKYNFSAAGSTKAGCVFLDERLNKLEIAAIYLDTIEIQGIAVGTLCTLADYLMAFLHWRALLLDRLEGLDRTVGHQLQVEFAATLCLGQVPSQWSSTRWQAVCYSLFAKLLHERLPHLPLDQTLRDHRDFGLDVEPGARRQFLQMHFGDRMMGRCFCRMRGHKIGMGTGFMLPGDIVVVPLGCSTPVILRAEGTRGEYRFVGDVYVHGYMNGEAVEQVTSGLREVKKYVLH